jgi:hypothetical protein
MTCKAVAVPKLTEGLVLEGQLALIVQVGEGLDGAGAGRLGGCEADLQELVESVGLSL